MPRRRVRTLFAISLALGAISTLTATWLVPLTLLRLDWLSTTNSADTWWTDGVRGGHYIRQHHALHDGIDFRRIIFTGTAESQPYYNQNPPPRWAAVVSLDQREGFEQVWTGAFGWPCRAAKVESWQRWNLQPLGANPIVIDLPSGGTIIAQSPRFSAVELRGGLSLFESPKLRVLLPLTPIWPGLVADLAIFTFIWWVALVGLRTSRRVIRLRRALCPACAYDLRATPAGSPCPECGAPAP